ncbi:MAG TPA: NAD(P)/FAD-dependent oxidoreductase [Polyangiaceae bacterium]|nr:NAD(P)/FAD-dependent oxidoreductase [Polyangiaceae bacterium]
MNHQHEVVILGGGHNGLTVACYLAKAGVDVCVLEALPYTGGGVISPPTAAPGFKTDICSIWHGFIQANPLLVNDELELRSKFGLKYLTSENQFAVLFPDDSYINLDRDVDRTCQSIAKFSERDAEAYRRFCGWSKKMLGLLVRGMFNPPPPFGVFASMLEQSEEERALLRSLMVSALDICDEWFEDERLKVALMKFCAEASISPRTKGTGIVMFMFIPLTHEYGGAIPQGGSGALSEAMERRIVYHGGAIRTGSTVERVPVSGGKATGVVLKGGEQIAATKAVVSNLHAKQLVRLVGGDALPESFVGQLGRLKRSAYGALSQGCAIRQAPRYRAGDEVSDALFVEFAPLPMEKFLRSFDDYEYGRPHVHMPAAGCQTRLDPTRAPAGQHTLHLFHYAPFELADGGAARWDDLRQEMADGILATLQRQTTNMGGDNLIGRLIETPYDLSRRNPAMIDGDYNHIGMFLDQQLGNRYLPGWGYRTPIEQLWMCGPSCHPGGGVTGGGRAAVQPVLASLGIGFEAVVGR